MKRARRVASQAPDLLDEVIAGSKTVNAAAREADQRSGSREPLLESTDSDSSEEPSEELRPIDAVVLKMESYNKRLDSMARELTDFYKAERAELFDETIHGIIQNQLKVAAGNIRQQKGAGPCPYCRAKGCGRCGNRGFLSKTSLDSVPRSVLDAAELEWATSAAA